MIKNIEALSQRNQSFFTDLAPHIENCWNFLRIESEQAFELKC